MKNKMIRLALFVVFLISTRAYSQEDKFAGALTRESDVPNYTLPDLLTTFSGKK